MTVDAWQIIFDKAGELADSLLHEQPKSQVDVVDIEEQIHSAVRSMAYGHVNPKDDWSVMIRPVRKGKRLDDAINEHFDIALRQALHVRVLFEYHMQKVKENFSESAQPGKLLKIGEDMLSAFACAQQHATAWRLLVEVRDKSFETRSKNANQVKAEKKEEADLLMRSLAESALSRLRPSGGWRSYVEAAQAVTKEIRALAVRSSLPIPKDEDKLSDAVQKMIWKEARLRKVYNENAKKPLEEPVKLRRATVGQKVKVPERSA